MMIKLIIPRLIIKLRCRKRVVQAIDQDLGSKPFREHVQCIQIRTRAALLLFEFKWIGHRSLRGLCIKTPHQLLHFHNGTRRSVVLYEFIGQLESDAATVKRNCYTYKCNGKSSNTASTRSGRSSSNSQNEILDVH